MAAADDQEGSCQLFQCFCKWRKRCSPRIPRVCPERDFVCISSDAPADSTPKWSVLVGCTSANEPVHNLRTHRFRVADSGRVMGCNDDVLERFRAVCPDDAAHTVFSSATASMAPNGRNLCIICAHYPSFHTTSGRQQDADLLPKAFLMDSADKSLTALPPLPFQHSSYQSVSAHGQLWTPATVEEAGPFGTKRQLVMYQLDGRRDSWANISDIDFPYRPPVNITCGGPLLHGYAVISDRFILLSFIDLSFFCFDCAAGTLTQVTTLGETSWKYVPIRGRAVHVANNDNGVYFLERGTLFRYSYSPESDKPLKPPKMIDTICPYRKEGYGFVVHLKDGLACFGAKHLSLNPPMTDSVSYILEKEVGQFQASLSGTSGLTTHSKARRTARHSGLTTRPAQPTG
ncbi:hypothetical protein E2562_020500 [Oryza meyeriana var. granulata]|uniref:Uncharacterized protein n=1 Tax=Oryza meyeriana var. granulata TaxID=110450 RepID=A0A6G1D5S5_9ORYZ|nr:hypothetical protein E2562_020500 [Oryza meyeriana var. granulata]